MPAPSHPGGLGFLEAIGARTLSAPSAGNAAGAITVYLFDEANHGEHPPESDVVIDSLLEFPAVLARGLG